MTEAELNAALDPEARKTRCRLIEQALEYELALNTEAERRLQQHADSFAAADEPDDECTQVEAELDAIETDIDLLQDTLRGIVCYCPELKDKPVDDQAL